MMESFKNLVMDKVQDAMILPTMKDQLKGLGIFIADIRRCKSKEDEFKRVSKELGKIRAKLKSEKSLDGYQRKKYIAKLLFIYLLGHTVDFGHTEAINLASSLKFSEKSIGYMFISTTFALELDSEILPLLIHAFRTDLRSNINLHNVIALQTCANMCSLPIVEALHADLYEIFKTISMTDSPLIPSAIPCYTAFIRCKPEIAPHSDEDVAYVSNFIRAKRFTIANTAINLLEELLKLHPDQYQSTLSTLLTLLDDIISKNERDRGNDLNNDQIYFMFYMPWALVKILKVLRLYNYDEPSCFELVKSYLLRIIDLTSLPNKMKRSHHTYTKYSIGYEAVNLIIHLDCELKLMHSACSLLMSPLNSTDPNLKGLGLILLTKMAQTETGLQLVEKLAPNVINVLQTEMDACVRRLGFEVAYTICNKDNVEIVISQILNSLPKSSNLIRQNLALRMAILAEKFAPSFIWYIDQMLKLIHISGESVSENVWFRVVQVISNHEEVQGHAAKSVFKYLQMPDIKENLIKVGSYIIGEFGNLIANDPRSSPLIQLQLLQSWVPYVSISTKYIIITAYGKLRNLYPEIRSQIEEILSSPGIIGSLDVELQQRAVEMLALSKLDKPELLVAVFEVMPHYNENSAYLTSKIGTRTVNKSDDLSKTSNQTTERTDVFGDITSSQVTSIDDTKPTLISTGALESFNKFMLMQDGCLFVSDLIKIDAMIINATHSNPTSTISLTILNKTRSIMTDFTVCLVSDHISSKCVKITFIPCAKITPLDKGELVASVTLMELFDEPIQFYLNFQSEKRSCCYRLYLPSFIQHFIAPVSMLPSEFFNRWRALSINNKEVVHVIKTPKSMQREFIDDIMKLYHFEILLGVDPNALNYCVAAGLYALTFSAGILLRLEVNLDAQAYRLTVKSSSDIIAEYIADKIKKQLQ